MIFGLSNLKYFRCPTKIHQQPWFGTQGTQCSFVSAKKQFLIKWFYPEEINHKFLRTFFSFFSLSFHLFFTSQKLDLTIKKEKHVKWGLKWFSIMLLMCNAYLCFHFLLLYDLKMLRKKANFRHIFL